METTHFKFRWESLFTGLLVIPAILHTIWRLRYGVDFADEAWYLVLGFRFSQGARPLIDEQNIVQSMGLLIAPVVGTYFKWKGSLDGLVYSTRLFYLAMVLCVAAYLYRCLKTLFNPTLCACVLALYVLYFPFAIPNISYYSLGLAFFTLGLFIAHFDSNLPLAGACHSLGTIAFPPLVVAVLFNGLELVFGPQKNTRKCLYYFVSFLFVSVFISLIYGITPKTALTFFREIQQQSDPHKANQSLMRFPLVVFSLIEYFFRTGFFIIALLFFVLSRKPVTFTKKAIAFLLLLTIILVVNRPSWQGFGCIGIILYFSSLAPLFLTFTESKAAGLFRNIWLPSIVAGFCMAMASLNGILSASVGFFPAFLVGTLLFLQQLNKNGRVTVYSCIALLGFIATFLFFQRTVFNEGNVSLLTERIEHGPFAGLYTNPIKKHFLIQLEEDLRPLQAKYSQILVSPHFPAAYLLFPGVPVADNTWETCFGQDSRRCLKNIKDHFGNHMLVLLLNYRPIKPEDYDFYEDQTNSVFSVSAKRPPLLIRKEYVLFDGLTDN